MLTLVRALVVSKVDYCMSVLAGISRSLQNRLQLVLKTAAQPGSQNSTGSEFPSVSSSGYVYWLIAVCPAQRQLTYTDSLQLTDWTADVSARGRL